MVRRLSSSGVAGLLGDCWWSTVRAHQLRRKPPFNNIHRPPAAALWCVGSAGETGHEQSLEPVFLSTFSRRSTSANGQSIREGNVVSSRACCFPVPVSSAAALLRRLSCQTSSITCSGFEISYLRPGFTSGCGCLRAPSNSCEFNMSM